MRTLTRIDSSVRSREGWVALPILIRGLEEAQHIVVETTSGRFIVGHAVRSGRRWWLVPDWNLPPGSDLAPYEAW